MRQLLSDAKSNLLVLLRQLMAGECLEHMKIKQDEGFSKTAANVKDLKTVL